MTNRSKGRAFEKLIGAYLREKGWVVDDQPRGKVGFRPVNGTMRAFSSPVDLWGCIDIAAMHPTEGLWFIQATSGGDVAAKRREVGALPWPFIARLRVSVMEEVSQRNVVNRRMVEHLARVHDLTITPQGPTWLVSPGMLLLPRMAPVPRKVPAISPAPVAGEEKPDAS